jgi:RimJ/RimL family protein N-acetyltransferase
VKFPFEYKVLKNQTLSVEDFSIVPIRWEDRSKIMVWRNEQVYHLRQSKTLTIQDQDDYFSNIVSRLFNEEQPNQILFSYLKGEDCIGYGGLVHINWTDKNAEISFIMKTQLEENFFDVHWKTYLSMIEKVAFDDLILKKIYTYAFDLRPKLYSALMAAGFFNEARLKDHCYFDGKFKDVVIHSKFNTDLSFRPAALTDLEITYQWASDKEVRKYAISQTDITFKEHSEWLLGKLKDPNCLYYIASNANIPVGSFRVDIDENGEGTISYLLSSDFHGRGLGGKMLRGGVNFAKNDLRIRSLVGKVFKQNKVSCLLFEKLAFDLESNEPEPLVYKMMIR